MSNFNCLEMESLITVASNLFRDYFHDKPDICGCGPGRVNLIGEHTDYNDGFVLPLFEIAKVITYVSAYVQTGENQFVIKAIPMITVMVGKKNLDMTCCIMSDCPNIDDPKVVEFQILPEENNAGLKVGKPHWANYVKGVIANYKGKVCGFNAIIATSIPVGGGLSSSAALEVATYTFLDGLSEEPCKFGLANKALACQKAEHEFAGMPCGIMDQYISFMGKKDHALLLDCRSLQYDLVNVKSPDIAILITNTNVNHNLADGEYSKRKEQCEKAAEILGKKSLRDVELSELENQKDKLGNPIYYRAFHVVTEIQRTKEAAKALKNENYEWLGMLMQESHRSLRDYYEVSCPELNEVVNATLTVDGVFGSRMTGGGFGGCTVTLLKVSCVENTIKNVMEKYSGNPTFYMCRPADGAKLIKLHV